MPPRAMKADPSQPLGFEDLLWKAADKLRGSMDASEYQHVVLGLIFLNTWRTPQGQVADHLDHQVVQVLDERGLRLQIAGHAEPGE